MKIRYRRSYVFAVLLLWGAASCAWGQQKKVIVHLDASQTEIHWTLGDVLHSVHGTFKLKGGLVTLNPATGEAQGEILVDAESGESGNKTRDNLMKKNQLETAKYPQVIFHPERFTGSLAPGSAQNVTVGGMFNIHGSDHPLTLNLKVQTNGNQVMATTHFVVPYVAWGMKDPSTLMLRVAKEVKVDVTARGWIEEGK